LQGGYSRAVMQALSQDSADFQPVCSQPVDDLLQFDPTG